MNKDNPTNFKETEIGPIPEEWGFDCLSNHCKILGGKRLPKEDCLLNQKTDHPYIRITDLGDFGVDESGIKYISDETHSKIKKYIIEKGDVYISNVGTIGSVGLIRDGLSGANLTENAVRLTKLDSLNNLFIGYYLKSKVGQDQIRQNTVGAVQPKLPIYGVGNIKIPIPKLEEQEQIAEILSSLDDKIELNRQMNTNLEKVASALFKRWFVDFEFPDKNGKPYKSSGGKIIDSGLGPIPEGWNVSKIGIELETFLGGTPSRTKDEYWTNGTIPWVNSGKVNEYRIVKASEYISEKALSSSATKLLPKGTVVIAITGATLGQFSLLEIDSSFNQSVIGIKECETLKKEFIYYWIANNIKELINAQTGGAQQHINKQVVDSYKILMPDEKILREYYELVSPFFDLIGGNCFENENLLILRDSLLPRLMNGKIRVKI